VGRRKPPSPPRFHRTLRRQVTERDARRILRDGLVLEKTWREFGSSLRIFVRVRYKGAHYVAWMLPEDAKPALRSNKALMRDR
jgi:hypothetical protein